MKDRCLAILLLVSLISAGFSRAFIYAGFEANRQYIAEQLCENRARPLLQCNGRCYLMKKLKAAEEKEQEQTAKDHLNRLEISFFQEPFKLSFIEPIVLDSNPALVSTYDHQYSRQYLDAIFRPPRQIA